MSNNETSAALRDRLQDIFSFGGDGDENDGIDDSCGDSSDSEDSDIPAIFTDEERECPDLESPSSPTEPAVFQDLPPELRLLVCKSAVVKAEPIDLSKKLNHTLPRITQTSKFFRTEGTRLYYKLNAFLVPLPSGLTAEESDGLDRWLRADASAEACGKMRKIVAQVPLSVSRRSPDDRAPRYGVDRVGFANLLHLGLHFRGLSSERARRVVGLQVFVTTVVGFGDAVTTEQALATPDVVRQVVARFWETFDGSLGALGRGRYGIPWTDEDEMDGNQDVPLLERSVALGCIIEELERKILVFWNEEQFPDTSEAQYLESID